MVFMDVFHIPLSSPNMLLKDQHEIPFLPSSSASDKSANHPVNWVSSEIDNYSLEQELSGHTDWVRDVAWAPSILPKTYIASASQDKSVIIWTSDAGGPFQKKVLTMDAVVWRVSWSLSGNVLAVSGGDNKVTLWKENLQGNWEKVTTVEE